MEVGQGPNWGCSAKEKKMLNEFKYRRVGSTNNALESVWKEAAVA
jgi:hypothetical protein